MARSGLLGPFNLTTAGIDFAVTKTSPGAFVLGSMGRHTFDIAYVGRSDSDVKAQLRRWVGMYDQFKFRYFDSPVAAFEKECDLFHDFGGPTLDSRSHPSRPLRDRRWKCPRCSGIS